MSASIKIEKGIPIHIKSAYPFSSMEIGDSFFVKGLDSGRFSSTICYAKVKNPGMNFTSRTVDGGVRVWRIK